MSAIDEIMKQADDYADAERCLASLLADECDQLRRNMLRLMLEGEIAAALADAERKGAEAMRERIFAKLGAHYGDATGMHLAVARELDSIRSMPLPTGSQS